MESEQLIEYVLLDLGAELHGAGLHSGAPYRITGLDTEKPELILDNGIKLIGHYEDVVGTYLLIGKKSQWMEEGTQTREELVDSEPWLSHGEREEVARQSQGEGEVGQDRASFDHSLVPQDDTGARSSSGRVEREDEDAGVAAGLLSSNDASRIPESSRHDGAVGCGSSVFEAGVKNRVDVGDGGRKKRDTQDGQDAASNPPDSCPLKYLCTTRKRLRFKRVVD